MAESPKRSIITIKIGAALFGFAFLVLCGPYLLSLLITFPFSNPYSKETVYVTIPMLCPAAPEEGLSADRSITVNFHDGERYLHHPIVHDIYTLHNSTQQDMELTFYYPRFCENSLAEATLIVADNYIQQPEIYTANRSLDYSSMFSDHTFAVTLLDYLREDDLEQALMHNKAPDVLSQEIDQPIVWYYEITAVIPAESEVTIYAQWQEDRWEHRFQAFTALCYAPDMLPCETQSLTLWNYEEITIKKQSLDFRLKRNINKDYFVDNTRYEYLIYDFYS